MTTSRYGEIVVVVPGHEINQTGSAYRSTVHGRLRALEKIEPKTIGANLDSGASYITVNKAQPAIINADLYRSGRP